LELEGFAVSFNKVQNPVKGTPYFRSKLTPYFTAGIF
jgi:hypothetical protein